MRLIHQTDFLPIGRAIGDIWQTIVDPGVYVTEGEGPGHLQCVQWQRGVEGVGPLVEREGFDLVLSEP